LVRHVPASRTVGVSLQITRAATKKSGRIRPPRGTSRNKEYFRRTPIFRIVL